MPRDYEDIHDLDDQSDGELRDLVRQHLAANNTIDVDDITVRVEKGTVVLGTVKGDMHDIGKNLVRMMLEGKGLAVVDLGVNVPPETFVEEAEKANAAVICCSALLTTTMNEMRNVVSELERKDLHGKIKVMVGGAPVTQQFCDAIGADCYTPDAASAADAALALCRKAAF
jgi:methanogenic corrinoid protein MtbC1